MLWDGRGHTHTHTHTHVIAPRPKDPNSIALSRAQGIYIFNKLPSPTSETGAEPHTVRTWGLCKILPASLGEMTALTQS